MAPTSFDEETYNRYLLDASGPKKVIDYSSAQPDYVDDYEVGEEAVEGQYRMKHTNQKFRIGGLPAFKPEPADEESIQKEEQFADVIKASTGQTADLTEAQREEKELLQALEQIRQMENRELIAKEATELKSRVADYLNQGEYVYELYSIMVHSGGAFGGHYYAYVKSFEDGKWYNFNDSSVTELKDEQELFKTFGDGSGNSGTAYLLMYRKITGEEQPYKFPEALVPDYLKAEIEAETEKLIAEQKAREEKLLNLKLKVYY